MCVLKEKGKVVNLETDEEEEELENLIIEEDEDEGMEVEIEVAHPPTKLPAYTPYRSGRQKCPKTSTRARALCKLCSSQMISFFRARTWDGCQT